MKKLIAFVLVAIMMLSLVSCGNSATFVMEDDDVTSTVVVKQSKGIVTDIKMTIVTAIDEDMSDAEKDMIVGGMEMAFEMYEELGFCKTNITEKKNSVVASLEFSDLDDTDNLEEFAAIGSGLGLGDDFEEAIEFEDLKEGLLDEGFELK